MDQVTDDVWILIFREYLEDPSTMPISLTPVCRYWYNLIRAIPSLWFRVIIKVKGNDDIAPILSSIGLADYLSRGDRLNIPLDIELRCCEPPIEEHRAICGRHTPYICSPMICGFISARLTLLKALLQLLADKEFSNEREGVSEPELELKLQPGLRINRWRAFSFEWNGFTGIGKGFYSGIWSIYPFPCAPQLSHLMFQNVPPWFEPIGTFAPNLTNVTMRDVDRNWDPQVINTPSLKSLSLQSNHGIPWGKMHGICPVEELEIAEDTGLQPSSIEFPNLKRMKIREYASSYLLIHLKNEFERSNRRLDVIHLVKYDLSLLNFNPEHLSILTNARRIVLEIQAERQRELYRACNLERPVERSSLEKLLDLCALDTDVVAVDEEYAIVLATAREAVLQSRAAPRST